MHNKQQLPMLIQPDDGIARLIRHAGIDHTDERIEERLRRLFEGNAMLVKILRRFCPMPDKGNSIQLEMIIHDVPP